MKEDYSLRSGLLLCVSLLAVACGPGSCFAANPADDRLAVALCREDKAPELFQVPEGSAPPVKSVLGSDLATPFGSLWKLFVYFYIAETGSDAPRFVCSGADPDEVFCCKPKNAIEMDDAIIKSCGLFFAPERLGVAPSAWERFWREKMGITYPWLTTLRNLREDQEVPVIELLNVLDAIKRRGTSFSRLNSVLARVLIDGTAKGAVRKLGSLYRVKTYTWNNPVDKNKLIGGFAGWLNDGTPIWVTGRGTSTQVVSRWSGRLLSLAGDSAANPSRRYVEVDFFDRYPIKEVASASSGAKPGEGPLYGKFSVFFKNGNTLDFTSNGEIRLRNSGSGEALSGFFDINEYVARVIDREIQAGPAEAAKSLAIIIRTYLLQNAKEREGCYHIKDSTRFQRVSINPPSQQAKRVAAWSDNLIIEGAPGVQYHRSSPGPNTLSWEQAKQLAAAGYYYDQILRTAYPQGQIGVMDTKEKTPCRRLNSAEAWLKKQSKMWVRHLEGKPGFQEPGPINVCELETATPYSDFKNNRIFMHFTPDMEDYLTAAHEYLHLSYKNHPAGLDEDFIETTARELVLGAGDIYEYN